MNTPLSNFELKSRRDFIYTPADRRRILGVARAGAEAVGTLGAARARARDGH